MCPQSLSLINSRVLLSRQCPLSMRHPMKSVQPPNPNVRQERTHYVNSKSAMDDLLQYHDAEGSSQQSVAYLQSKHVERASCLANNATRYHTLTFLYTSNLGRCMFFVVSEPSIHVRLGTSSLLQTLGSYFPFYGIEVAVVPFSLRCW